MASLQEFLQEHSDLIVSTPQDNTDVELNGVFISATQNNDIIFGYLDQRFHISPNDVISIEVTKDAANNFGEGIPVKITVKADTQFILHQVVMAHTIDSDIPFAIARPSQIPEIDYPHITAKELAWMVGNGISFKTDSQKMVQSLSTPPPRRPDDNIIF